MTRSKDGEHDSPDAAAAPPEGLEATALSPTTADLGSNSTSMKSGPRAAQERGSSSDFRDSLLAKVTQALTPKASGTITPAFLREGELVGGEDGKRFELIERLGAGSMGVVFLARDCILERTVAIKFITQGKSDVSGSLLVDLFMLEARATAKLSHENIVRIFDLGSQSAVPFLVIEHLEGRSLGSLLAQEELHALKVTRIMTDVARGLAHAHKAGIVHRDLKPNNIFVLRDGRVKILDFGLASIAAGMEQRSEQSPSVAGTPTYMAPEQWEGKPQDGRTDIWAAGVIFFLALTGRPPFAAKTSPALRQLVLSDAPAPSVREFRPDLPEEAERVVQRTLSKDMSKRFGTADELLDALVSLEVVLTRSVRDAAAREIRDQRLPRLRPERRQMTLMSCALSDIALLSEQLELEHFSELLNSFFEICATVSRQLEGTVVTSLGGRVIVCFGYPIAHEDNAQRAVRAAVLITEALRTLKIREGLQPSVRIGIHTSLVIAGKLADDGVQSGPLIQGEAPHVAAWLESKAHPNEILISQLTHTLASGLFETEAIGLHALEAGARPLEIHRVLRQKVAASRFEQTSARGLTPLVGRNAEAEKLLSLWNKAREGQGQCALLSGEAGIGKSRLVELLKEQVSPSASALMPCQCWSHFRNSTLHPLVGGLQRLLDLRPDGAASERLQRLEAAVTLLGLPVADYVPLLGSHLSIPLSGAYAAPALSPDAFKNKLLEALVSTVLQVAARQPLLCVFEDVHWTDASTLEFLDLLLHRLSGARVMVLITFRPEFQSPWPERPYLHRLALRRLSLGQTSDMVTLVGGGRELPAEVLEHLVKRTDGVPLFVEELTRVVVESWQAAEQRGEAPSVETFTSQLIPASLNELLAARLDRLAGAGKEVAQLGAVLGRDFTYQLIQRASPLDEETLRGGLLQLVEAGLLRHEGQLPETRYVFNHALTQDAAYQSQLKAKRQENHRRAAEALAQHYPEIVEAQPELLAHHSSEAGDGARAIGFFEKAGQRASQRSANIDAVSHYSHALQLLAASAPSPERDRKELSLQLALGAPLMATKGYAAPEVKQTYGRARELCRLAGDDAQLFPSVLGLWQFYMVGGEAPTSAELGKQLLAQAERSGDRTMLMLAHRALGTSLMLLGELTACRSHCEQGLLLYDREQHGKLALRYGQDPGVTNGLYLAWSLWFLGYADQALDTGRKAVQLARDLEHPLSIAFAMNYLATVHNYRGEHDAAKALAEEAAHICAEHKLALWQAMCRIQRGWALLSSGERAEGIKELKEGVAGWTKTGAKAGLTFFLSALIWGLWQAGLLDEAMRTIEEMETIVRTKGERFFEAELLRLRAEVTLAIDPKNEAAAEDCLRRGLKVARSQQASAWELRLATSLGRMLVSRGQKAEARQLVQPIYDWFKEGLDTADLRAAQAFLHELA